MLGWNSMGSNRKNIANERNLFTSVMTISQLNIDNSIQILSRCSTTSAARGCWSKIASIVASAAHGGGTLTAHGGGNCITKSIVKSKYLSTLFCSTGDGRLAVASVAADRSLLLDNDDGTKVTTFLYGPKTPIGASFARCD